MQAVYLKKSKTIAVMLPEAKRYHLLI